MHPPSRNLDALGTRQQAILERVWQRDGATVAEICEDLAPGARPAYTTVLSVLQKLERQGWVSHRREGRRYVYSATCSRSESARTALLEFVERIYLGDPTALLRELTPVRPPAVRGLPSLRAQVEARRGAA